MIDRGEWWAAAVLVIGCLSMVGGVAQAAVADQPDKTEQDRFYEAISKGDVAAVRALLEAHPALVNARSPRGRSAVLVAAARITGEGFTPPASNLVLQAILEKKPRLSFFDACVVGDADAVARELDKDPKLALAWDDTGWSGLHMAAFSGSARTVDLLLARGAAIEARARTRFRNTPLQVALLPGQYETAKLLLERGADALARQALGFAPIHEAALLGRRDLVDLLLAHGAEINSRSDDGRTPVNEALRSRHGELAEYLKSKGGRTAEITSNLMASPE